MNVVHTYIVPHVPISKNCPSSLTWAKYWVPSEREEERGESSTTGQNFFQPQQI